MWKLSDESLLAGFASKDPDVTAAFVRRFQGRVFGLALTIVKDAAVAEEISQETMARAWEHAGAYDARRGRVDTWLLTIARNLSIDARRVRAREVTDYDDEAMLRLISSEPDPEGRGVLADEIRRLHKAIVELSEEQRRVLLLATFQGLSGKEVSEAEGIPLGTAKTRLHAAMLNLRAALEVSRDQ
ncbi:MAG TPA: sigma-70 family RNA polymerase sigma factor [Actinomycetota bacterium]|nr:sigma-70 family RNA polymerase sigma factor [Actinomycetota bacterium]